MNLHGTRLYRNSAIISRSFSGMVCNNCSTVILRSLRPLPLRFVLRLESLAPAAGVVGSLVGLGYLFVVGVATIKANKSGFTSTSLRRLRQ